MQSQNELYCFPVAFMGICCSCSAGTGLRIFAFAHGYGRHAPRPASIKKRRIA